MKAPFIAFALSFSLSTAPVLAQTTGPISGVVIDQESKKPLSDVHVFLSNTTKGDISGNNGAFSIATIQPGTYQLVVMRLGYTRHIQSIVVSDKPTYLEISLSPLVYEMEDVTVDGGVAGKKRERLNKKWNLDLSEFTKRFLGETQNRRGCKIVNPDVIWIDKIAGLLTASATEPIIIENRSLGYRLTYALEEFWATNKEFRFTGEPFFEELESSKTREIKRWRERRIAAFEGSLLHFLRSLAANRLKENGFEMYAIGANIWKYAEFDFMLAIEDAGARVWAYSVLAPSDVPHERTLLFGEYLHVMHKKTFLTPAYYKRMGVRLPKHREYTRSSIELLNSYAVFNELGFPNNPLDISRSGYWSWTSGVCNWLPFDYENP